tara:strand:- start:7997 stop:9739 length:1743 start_codon:yes stop_codon:yes gene_type:complete
MGVVRLNIPSKAKLPDKWDEIREDFPMPSPRKYQSEVLSVIYHALGKDDFDNIVVQAPTGIGKSAIAMTIQNQFQSAYLLTPSLGLANQYMSDYGHVMKEVRGRANFPCWIKSGTADGAPCWTKRGGACPHSKEFDPCPYYEQKFDAANARLTLSNPAYLFRVIQGDQRFERRDFAIIDEAHQMEDFLLDLLGTRITEADWKRVHGPKWNFPMHYHPADWVDDIRDFGKSAEAHLKRAEDEDNDTAMKTYRGLVEKAATVMTLLQEPENVIVKLDKNKFGRFIDFNPVRVRKYADEMLDTVSRKRIFLSATILDIDTFLHSLGLEDQKTLYVNVTETPFPKDCFNIHYCPVGSMSYSRREKTIPKQVKAIQGIMERFPNKRGVILPHSHYIRESLVKGLTELGFEDRIVTHGSDVKGREAALDYFFKSERDDLVLISTYVTEGFDFKGKLAEWLVLCKVPYLPIANNPTIETRLKEDEHQWRQKYEGGPDCPYEPPTKYSNGMCGSFACPAPCKKWYNLQTALTVVQGAGRIVRQPEDKGHIFLLDQSWARFQRMNAGLLPSWFRNNIKEMPTWLRRYVA